MKKHSESAVQIVMNKKTMKTKSMVNKIESGINREKPTVSVIIPTYNRENRIGNAIRSVLSQTFPDFEIIVVDDASQDNTKEMVAGLSDERIRYIKHDKNRGGSAARNSGIKTARGKYIAFLDDDDEWMPAKLEKQVSKFMQSSEKVGLIYCGYICLHDGKAVSENMPEIKGAAYIEALNSCFVGGPTPLVKKECFSQAGYFDETLKTCQDWDMWIRVAKYYDVDYVSETLAHYTLHGSQLSSGLNRRISAREMILEKYRDDLKAIPPVLSYHLQRLGSLYVLADCPSKGLQFIRRSIQTDPLNWKRYLHFLMLFFSSALYKKLLYRYGLQRVGNIILYH